VVIESPTHLHDLSTLETAALELVVDGYRRRYAEMAGEPEVARVLLFRNRGRGAGTSLRHPHTQLFALEVDPPEIQAREESFRQLRRDAEGHCPLCEPERFEPGFEARLLHRNRHFTCWVPWAAEAPCEVWIAPRRHTPRFEELTARECRSLAGLLGWVARRLRDRAGDPDYNLLLHAASPRDPMAHELHWWMRFRPRVGQLAGLELLSGILVNPSSPARDAGRLRGEPLPEGEGAGPEGDTPAGSTPGGVSPGGFHPLVSGT
jgi:UDPglucose--hexose-1-phosphate uridylyltransferase